MNKIWYESPAKDWNEAIPIGNGFLGAMIFGSTNREVIQLNEDSLWSGKAMNRNNPSTLEHLEEIRNLIFNGEISKAEKLMLASMSGIPECQRSYQTLGNLHIDFPHKNNECKNYKRELFLDKGIAEVTYNYKDTAYKREYLASYPKNLIAIRISSEKKGSVSFRLSLKRHQHIDNIEADGNVIKMTGSCGMDFACCLKVETKNGKTKIIGQYIYVENADSAVIYLTAATEFRCDDVISACMERLASVSDYELIKKEHIKDFYNIYGRVSLELNNVSGKDFSDTPTDKRLKEFKCDGSDNGLVTLYFNFGRYLLISSSRSGTLPANLQGIWNKDYFPAWDSKYTININTEMNYWHAEVCALSELHLPLFELIKRMVVTGRETARIMYGCKGFLAHHNTDIWADTAPQDEWIPSSYWVMSAAWLCLHIWEHYVFTLDKDFLGEYYYVIKEACEFFVDFLVEDKNGKLVTVPSVSPENVYILPNGEQGSVCYAPAMDNQIMRNLFNAFIESTEILDKADEKEFVQKLKDIKSKLYENKIGSKGQLLEWSEEWGEAEPGHRHISHLFDLYPGYGINPETTPELANAAKKTLEMRLSHGGGHTGWSRAWIINMWARLLDGKKAYENVSQLLIKSTLPNLLDNHPPFQIDGNFGGTAGIAEMLLQSHTSVISLLPAIPEEWASGNVSGLKARGGLTVDMTWQNGKIIEACIVSVKDCVKKVKANGEVFEIKCLANQKAKVI